MPALFYIDKKAGRQKGEEWRIFVQTILFSPRITISAKTISQTNLTAIGVGRNELRLRSIGASEKIKFSEQEQSDIVEPLKVTANDGSKEPTPRELGTKEELLNVFLRKKRW